MTRHGGHGGRGEKEKRRKGDRGEGEKPKPSKHLSPFPPCPTWLTPGWRLSKAIRALKFGQFEAVAPGFFGAVQRLVGDLQHQFHLPLADFAA